MIEYLYNPDIWTWKWSLRSIAPQAWVVPLIAALFTRHFYNRDHRQIIAFISFSLLMDHLSTQDRLEFLFSKDTNAPWYHLLVPILFYLLIKFFTRYIDFGKHQWVKAGIPVAYTVIVIVNAVWGDGFYAFPGIVIGLYSIIGMFFVIWYFVTLLETLETPYLERLPMFWISSGLLIYLASNFLLWVGLDLITFDKAFFDSIYRINNAATILLNIFFAIAICLNPKKENLAPETQVTK